VYVEVVPHNITASWQLWFNTGDHWGQNEQTLSLKEKGVWVLLFEIAFKSWHLREDDVT
jgi:hypothetical protein